MRGRKPDITTRRTTAFEAPTPPAWLSDQALTEWQRVLSLIAAACAVAQPDADVIAAYCETLVLFRQAVAQVARDGITYTADGGLVKRQPAVSIASDARKDLLRLAGELGMTPIARQRLRIDASKPD